MTALESASEALCMTTNMVNNYQVLTQPCHIKIQPQKLHSSSSQVRHLLTVSSHPGFRLAALLAGSTILTSPKVLHSSLPPQILTHYSVVSKSTMAPTSQLKSGLTWQNFMTSLSSTIQRLSKQWVTSIFNSGSVKRLRRWILPLISQLLISSLKPLSL